MSSLTELTLKEAICAVQQKQCSPAELHIAAHQAIAKHNSEWNVFLSLDNDSDKHADAQAGLPLAGVPVAVKDNFCTVGFPTTASANVLDGFCPQFESTVTTRLKKAGGVIIGKTNMDAWAHGSSTETSDFGPTKNPRNPKYLPGGSSGGSAAAMAGNLCIAALGTETAGSIRQPSAWCGVVGLKPTYGRVSRFGVVAMGSSLDCPGPMGKTVEDTAIMFETFAGHDSRDATSSPQEAPQLTKVLNKGVKGLRLGVTYIDHPDLAGTPAAKAIEAAAKILEQAGAIVELVPLSQELKNNAILTPDYAVGLYTVVQRGEVSSNLARYDGIRYGHPRSTFSTEARRRIMLGTFTLSKGYADRYYVKAQQVRSVYIQNYQQLFTKFDALLSPVSPGYALPLGASANSPLFGELEDLLVEPSAVSGLPAMSVPCMRDPETNLFIGLDIIAPQWHEETVVRVAKTYEDLTDWNEWAVRLRKGAQ